MRNITIVITGDKRWIEKTEYVSKHLDSIATRRALKELGDKLMRTLHSLFSPSVGGGRGQELSHGYTGAYGGGIDLEVTDKGLTISEGSARGGNFILSGTSPGKVTTTGGSPVIPFGAVEWAMGRLGAPEQEAFAIGRSIANRGIGWEGGSSPLQREPPTGEGRFAFPEWIIKEENKDDIEDAAERIGGLLVQYLDK